jgi:hypothetical protein
LKPRSPKETLAAGFLPKGEKKSISILLANELFLSNGNRNLFLEKK